MVPVVEAELGREDMVGFSRGGFAFSLGLWHVDEMGGE